jgi:K+-sensing histidine kinase KdpD
MTCRSPIGNIHNLAELILDDEGEMGQEERAEIVTMIRNLSQGAMNLLNDLLDITTIESGKIDLQPTPVAMRPYLRRPNTTIVCWRNARKSISSPRWPTIFLGGIRSTTYSAGAQQSAQQCH